MNILTEKFEEWFAEELKAGLVDIKLAVTRSRGITTQAVREEIVNIEALVKSGRVKNLPEPLTFISKEIEEKICSVSI